MTAYITVDINVIDPIRYEDDKKLAAPMVERYWHETAISKMVVIDGV